MHAPGFSAALALSPSPSPRQRAFKESLRLAPIPRDNEKPFSSASSQSGESIMSQAENLAPSVISRLLSEIRELRKNPPDGVSYVENEENSVSEIHAVLEGPEGTPFVGGRFRMKLIMSHEYPAAPPRGFFLTKIYHPNVAANGDICVNTLKKDWTPETTLKHTLQVIRCLLIVPFPESSLNDEAGKLFMDSYDEFARRARIMTEVHAMADDASETADEGDYKRPGGSASTSTKSVESKSGKASADGDKEGDAAVAETVILAESASTKNPNIAAAAPASTSVKKVTQQDKKKASLKRL